MSFIQTLKSPLSLPLCFPESCGVNVIYNSLLCLALLIQHCSLRWDVRLFSAQKEYFDLARTLAPECKVCCMPQLLHVGRNIRKIFWRDILTTGFLKMSGFNFFFFSEEPKTWHSLTCVSTVEGKVFCWLLPGKGNTFGSLKSRPVRNLCYGLNSRLNFTLANCCHRHNAKEIPFLFCFFLQWRRGIPSADQQGKMRVRLAQSGVRRRLSQPLQN